MYTYGVCVHDNYVQACRTCAAVCEWRSGDTRVCWPVCHHPCRGAGVIAVHHHARRHMSSGDLNSGPHAGTEGALPRAISLAPYDFVVILFLAGWFYWRQDLMCQGSQQALWSGSPWETATVKVEVAMEEGSTHLCGRLWLQRAPRPHFPVSTLRHTPLQR